MSIHEECGVFASHKDLGLVGEVFDREVLARNGNLSNAARLRDRLELSGAIFHSTSDTEIIAYLVTKERLTAPSIEDALSAAMSKLEGAYSLAFMSPQKLICARDPHGFRPLCYGKTADGSYAAASESCALTAVGAEFVRDLEPGEILARTHPVQADVVVDDSILRGTTSGRIVSLLREAGAREIHLRVSAPPPFLNPCYYGTDIDSRKNLIACHHSVEEIAGIIGADSLGYLPAEQLRELIERKPCCDACFTGRYPTPVPADSRKDRFERKLSEK